jgi:hypothetical protein
LHCTVESVFVQQATVGVVTAVGAGTAGAMTGVGALTAVCAETAVAVIGVGAGMAALKFQWANLAAS